ncbi:transposase (plasmid) [Azospirillum sp. B510]|nr:transposase [Azospirillum sp. B510]
MTLFPPELVAAFQGQPPPPALDRPPPDRESAQTVEKGHGRIETRRIIVSREVVPALDWPGVAQVCRIERTREVKGAISHEIVYVITSLDRDHASPAALLALARDHWGIENRLHWRRDVLLSEDASRVRSGAVPQAMAMLRNTMLGIANLFGAPLPAVCMACAEDRCATIATVKNGFLWMALDAPPQRSGKVTAS